MRRICLNGVMLVVLSMLMFFAVNCGGSDSDTGDPTDGDTPDGDTPDGDEPDGDEPDGDEPDGDEPDGDEPPLTGLRVELLSDGSAVLDGPSAGVQAGDYLIANERALFVIQGTGKTRSWVPMGGTLIDAVWLDGDEQGEDLLDEVSIITAILRGFIPETFEVIDDGSAGTVAHLRVTGRDYGIPIVDMAIPFQSLGLAVTLDYRLLPESRSLEITTTVASDSRQEVDLGDAVVWSNRLDILTPGLGWGLKGLAALGDFPAQFAVGDGIAYGYYPAEGLLNVPLDQADILPIVGTRVDIKPGQSGSFTRYFSVGPNLEAVHAERAAITGDATTTLTVTTSLDDPQDAGQPAQVEILDDEDIPVTTARIGDAPLAFNLPLGNYTVITRQNGRPQGEPVGPVTVGDEPVQAEIALPATGRITFTIGGEHFDGSSHDGLPCRISVQAGTDAASGAAIIKRVFSTDGQGTFLLEPGDYTLTASRGYEYDIVQKSITLAAKQTIDFTGDLTRVVDSTGWIASDFHMHTELSIDAVVPIEERVTQLAAVGLELTPITDHDHISNLDPLVDPLGLRDYLRVLVGDEVSPPWAHTNGIILTKQPERPDYFGVYWYKGYDAEDDHFLGPMSMPEIWTELHDTFDSQLVQINHPRGSQGYFDVIDYDPAVGVAGLEDGVFSEDFDMVELINSGAVSTSLSKVLPDWYSLLNQGIHVAGTAVSDSHTENNPGDGRSFVYVGKDDPNAVSNNELITAVKSLQVMAASGPFVTAEINGVGVGGTVTGDGPYEVAVHVQAPSWMPVDWIRIVVNGQTVVEEAVSGTETERYSATHTLPALDGDSWVAVLAGAPEKDLGPVSPGQPVLSILNPIFIDTDNNGYTAPGLP